MHSTLSAGRTAAQTSRFNALRAVPLQPAAVPIPSTQVSKRSTAAMAANSRVFNFSAGPAMLPLEVLEQTQRDTLNYNGSGMSVMEMSHRSQAFEGIIKQAEADLRKLLSIPDNYKVLFVQGGASTQFAAIPLNFTQAGMAKLVAAAHPIEILHAYRTGHVVHWLPATVAL
eukprot:GHRR01036893.1.p1 GENE.GHRR01036893.1~~GHRR01036893.1.p1  ORF type:complete len:171 (+),score=53.27 GHRR01036893.1:90-602(+)